MLYIHIVCRCLECICAVFSFAMLSRDCLQFPFLPLPSDYIYIKMQLCCVMYIPFAVSRVFLTPMTSAPMQPASIPTYLAVAGAVSDESVIL